MKTQLEVFMLTRYTNTSYHVPSNKLNSGFTLCLFSLGFHCCGEYSEHVKMKKNLLISIS